MEQLSPEQRTIQEALGTAEVNRKELVHALESLNQKDVSTLLEQLSSIPGSKIVHPFGYYEIPLFAPDVSRVRAEFPVQLVDDDDELWKKHPNVWGIFTGKACIKSSHFKPIHRITTIICRDLEQQAVEQAIEHEIREGLRLNKVRGLPYAHAEGFARATYCGQGGVWRGKNRNHFGYWANVFQAAQEKGFNDLKVVQELSDKMKPPYYPMREYDLYRLQQQAENEIIKMIGSNRPTEQFVNEKRASWDLLRYRTFATTRQFLESHGASLSLIPESEYWNK